MIKHRVRSFSEKYLLIPFHLHFRSIMLRLGMKIRTVLGFVFVLGKDRSRLHYLISRG